MRNKHHLLQLYCLLFLTAASTSLFSQNYWVKVTDNGFGNSSSMTTPTMKKFKNNIYITTSNYDTAKIYSSSTGNIGTFNKKFELQGYWGSAFSAIDTTPYGGGQMFIGTRNSPANKVFKTTDGSTFIPYLNASAGDIQSILAYKGTGSEDSMYVFINNAASAEVWRSIHSSNNPSIPNADWQMVYSYPAGYFNGAVIHNNAIFAIATSQKKIFIKMPGFAFDSIYYPTYPNANINNQYFSAIGTFNGKLYLGTTNYVDGTELWESGDNGNTWAMKAKYPNHKEITSFATNQGKLYFSLHAFSNAPIILSSYDGNNFNTLLSSNFNNPSDFKGNRGCIEFFQNHIYYSSQPTSSPIGTQLYKSCLTPILFNIPDQTLCNGDSATFTAPSGAGYSYLWNTGATTQSIIADTAGAYNCVITQNGCSSIDYVHLKLNPLPSVTTLIPLNTNQDTIICAGSSLNIKNIATSNIRIKDTTTYASTITIPSYNYIDIPINVPNGYFENANVTIEEVKIDSLFFSNNYDLEISIIPPSTIPLKIIDKNSVFGSNLIGTSIKKGSLNDISFGNAPYNGQYKPFNDYNGLTGGSIGNWNLRIQNYGPVINGELKGWSLILSTLDTILTYSWSPTTGVNPVSGSFIYNNTLTTSITPSATTAFYLSTTNSKGCTLKDTFDITVPKLDIIENDTALCFSGSVTLNAAPGMASTSWYQLGNPTAIATGPNTNINVFSTNSYYATNNIGGCIVNSDTVTITINPPITTVNISATPNPVCLGDSVQLTTTATGGTPFTVGAPYIYKWRYSANDSIMGNGVFHIPTTTTTYTLNTIDSIGCVGTYTVMATVNPLTDIQGNISYSSGTVNNSLVALYDTLTRQLIQDTITDGSGNYIFQNAPNRVYYLLTTPDPANPAYANLIPTYYGDLPLWEYASLAIHGCTSTSTFNILTYEIPPLPSGPGEISGRVVERDGFRSDRIPGDPIPGAMIKVGRKPPGGANIIASDTTNSNGQYRFLNMPLNLSSLDSYIVYVDIPGYFKDSTYVVNLNPVTYQFTNLNYTVDSNTVWIDTTSISTGIINSLLNNGFVSIQPNPASESTNLFYQINKPTNISVAIYNMLGMKLDEIESSNNKSAGTYTIHLNISKYPPGNYMIAVFADGKPGIQKLIISK